MFLVGLVVVAAVVVAVLVSSSCSCSGRTCSKFLVALVVTKYPPQARHTAPPSKSGKSIFPQHMEAWENISAPAFRFPCPGKY